MKKLTEKEVRTAIESVRTEDETRSVVRSFAVAQPELAAYVDSSSAGFSQSEKLFLMTASSTVWNVLTLSGLASPLIARDTIGKTVADIDREIRPVFERDGGDPLASMQAIVNLSSQRELLMALIGILLSATEDESEDRVREEILQSIFFRIMIVIEALSRADNQGGVR